MAMIYKWSIHEIAAGAKLGDKDYDTKEEAQAAYDELSEADQEKYQVVELGYQDGK